MTMDEQSQEIMLALRFLRDPCRLKHDICDCEHMKPTGSGYESSEVN